jgi:hypothetical protein
MIRRIGAVALLILAGCTGVPSIPGHQAQGAAIKASGGTFSATYSGNYTLSSCSSSNSGHFTFSGSGSGSFIHSSSEDGSMTQSAFSCVWSGTATLTSKLHPRNRITVRLSLNHTTRNSPCNPMHEQVVFIVTGGTGKFANAAGRGTILFSCNNGNYTDQWSGTITF